MPFRRRDLLALPSALAPALVPGLAALPRPAVAQGSAAAGRQALAFADAGRWAEATAAAAGADPLIARYVEWMRVSSRTSGATAAEIVRFGLANPDWPGTETIARRAEEALAFDPDDALAEQWFAARAARTLAGFQRAADVLARSGRSAEATATLRRGWVNAPGDAAAEGPYLDRAATVLTREDHWRRFDRTALLRQGAPARLVPLLEGRQGAIAAARLAYAADAPDADAPQNAAAARGDLGLAHERARWLRRRERDAEAAEAWAAAAALQRDLAPEVARALWTERQVLARKLLRLGQPRLAYRTAAEHGQAAPGEPRQEAEFLAGFIALRWLEDPAAAERHFIRVREDSQSLITRGRSHYWQGRAAQAQGQAQGQDQRAAARAREAFAQAAALPLGFYGQLGALALGEDGAALSARIRGASSPTVTAQQVQDVEAHELTRAVLALAALGEGRRARPLLLRLEELAAGPPGKLLVARLAQRTGRPDNPVWVVRRAGASGLVAREEGWPTPFPTPDDILEPAIVNAVTRQESNFDPQAVSPANARGLMQLLPATAAQVARQRGLAHQVGMLTTDPAHNMRLGAAFLSDLIGRTGALPLALAGYNAGPGRVTEWVGTYGDPRGGGGIAMLDWMELIPFAETRNYVQRVLENVAVYRAADPRFAAEPHPMAQWLRGDA
jgi:soluble lytic murein transglycosylase